MKSFASLTEQVKKSLKTAPGQVAQGVSPGSRILFSRMLRSLARLSFILVVITIPVRMRWILQSRPTPPVFADYTDFLLFIADIFMLATLFFWIATILLMGRRPFMGPPSLLIPLAGVTLMGLISVADSVDPALSFYHTIRLILLALFCVYVINESYQLKDLLLPVGFQVGIQAVVGISQVVQQRSLDLKLLGELELDPAWHGVSIVSAEGVRLLRAYGLSDHPNILGGCLAFGLLVMAAAYLKLDLNWRILVAGGFFLGSLALLLTFSRSAWVAVSAGFVCMLIVFARRYRPMLPAFVALFTATLFILLPFLWSYAPYFGVRLNLGDSFQRAPQEIQSIGERQLLNTTTNRLFVENALLGVGLGSLPTAMSQRFSDFPVNYQPAHFVLLTATAETGLIGGTFYLLLLVSPWLVMWMRRRHLRLTPDLAVSCALLLASTLVGFLDYYTWLLVPGRLWQYLIWGIWGSAYLAALEKN